MEMTKMEMELEREIEMLYNEWLEKTEKRTISYGEIAHIQSLNVKELNEMYEELLKELESDLNECN